MRLVFTILVAWAGFYLASFLALLSYGRFAERAQGEPSVSLPVSENATPLDGLVAPLVKERQDQSGLMLLDGNLDAFAVRALTAHRCGDADRKEEVLRAAVVAGGDPAEILEAAEQALDGVAIPVWERREAVLLFSVGLGRDVGERAAGAHLTADGARWPSPAFYCGCGRRRQLTRSRKAGQAPATVAEPSKETGAGEGIRTLDFNLGKVALYP